MQNTFYFSLTSRFMPHGHCFLWEPAVLWTLVICDVAIALSYFSIPFALVYFVKKRDDLGFSLVFLLFALFIVTCGIGHLIDVYNIWQADYYLSAGIRLVTAVASVLTAIFLYFKMPFFLAIPSTRRLETEIIQREEVERELQTLSSSLEVKVRERTRELKAFTDVAVDREERMLELKQRINELLEQQGLEPEFDLSRLESI